MIERNTVAAERFNGTAGSPTSLRGASDLKVRRVIPPKLYHIGEIVDYTGLSRQTIHNYTIMGLITEARRSNGGHRLYDESVFGRLDIIEEMKRRRKSLRQIRGRFVRMGASA